MKFLHLADLHLGRSLGDFDLYEDQKFILDQILHIADEKQADAVLIAGDVYDRAVPSEAAVRLFDHFLCCLADRGLYTFVISGNHDSDERLNFGSTLLTAKNIFISAKYDGTLYGQTLEDEFGKLHVWLMPFVKASRVKHFFPEEQIETYDDAVRVVLEHAGVDPRERNVLVAHQFVAGRTGDPMLGGSEGPSVKSVGTVEKISADRFDLFEYAALGHIHAGQRVGREEVRYAGSPLKYSLSEVHHQKSVPVVTVGEKGAVGIELVPLEPVRDLRHIRGPMRDLLDKNNVSAPDDFMYVTLTDEDTFSDVMGIFQQTYPNTVRIDYENTHTRELEQVDITNIAERRSFEEMISEFYRQMYGCDISEEELAVMKEVAGEAGVSDEAG